MSTADDTASLDAMRDMDEEDGAERMAPEGTYLFNIQTSYSVRAENEDAAYELLMEDTGESERIRVLDQDVQYVGEDT